MTLAALRQWNGMILALDTVAMIGKVNILSGRLKRRLARHVKRTRELDQASSVRRQ